MSRGTDMSDVQKKALAQLVRLRHYPADRLSEIQLQQVKRAEILVRDLPVLDALEFLIRSGIRLPSP